MNDKIKATQITKKKSMLSIFVGYKILNKKIKMTGIIGAAMRMIEIKCNLVLYIDKKSRVLKK